MTTNAPTVTNPQQALAEARATQSSLVVAGALLAVVGWPGLLWLMTRTLPTVPNRWAFYALLFIALTGTALPIVQMIHRRFSRQQGLFIPVRILIRQAAWLGILGTTLAWLRIPRLLSIPIALMLVMAMIAVEVLLRIRERTQWRPD
jgi:hypothetical protein